VKQDTATVKGSFVAVLDDRQFGPAETLIGNAIAWHRPVESIHGMDLPRSHPWNGWPAEVSGVWSGGWCRIGFLVPPGASGHPVDEREPVTSVPGSGDVTRAEDVVMREVVDLGEVLLVHNADTEPDLWLGPPGTTDSPRLVEAIARGEVTAGGLAEAGWHWIGKLSTKRTRSARNKR
jgi:hypothetical protein